MSNDRGQLDSGEVITQPAITLPAVTLPAVPSENPNVSAAIGVSAMGELFVPGQIVAETYRVRGLLGEGAMGAVYEADDLVLLRRVALKVARPGIDPASLRHEAQVLAALRHPSMVTVFSMGRHANIDFIVLERIYGVSLEVHISRRNEARKRFEIDEIVRVLLGIVEGVFVLHRAAITHRDVKPANIMIATEGRVVIMDLGLAVPWSDRVSRDLVSGTPAYMAPETISAEVKLGQENLVDLYAVGVIAYQMLTGAVPFIGSVNDVLLSQVIDNPPDLVALRPDTPAPLVTLVSRLLSKSPEERPHSAEAVVVELKAIAERRLLQQASRNVFVLIVDDDRVSGRVLEAIVRKAIPGVEVAIVTTGDEALALVTTRMPSILLLDIQLPGMSGIEVAMYLRGMQSINTCTIVAISGTAEEEDRLLLRDLGIVHFLRKTAQLHSELPALLASLEGNIADRKSTIPMPP